MERSWRLEEAGRQGSGGSMLGREEAVVMGGTDKGGTSLTKTTAEPSRGDKYMK